MHAQTLVVWAAAGPMVRRSGAHPLTREARLQEHQVPDEGGVHANPQRRLLERQGVRVVWGNVTYAARVAQREGVNEVR
jgi:hypothetical protein